MSGVIGFLLTMALIKFLFFSDAPKVIVVEKNRRVELDPFQDGGINYLEYWKK